MSYIFNEFSTGRAEGPAFSSVVSVAREKGYTVSTLPRRTGVLADTSTQEPHPADDLNGADVARKLTILSRIVPSLRAALPEGYKSVQTTSLVPAALESAATGDEFVARLPEFDAQFAAMRAEAASEGKVLRFVGVIDVASGVIKADLERRVQTRLHA